MPFLLRGKVARRPAFGCGRRCRFATRSPDEPVPPPSPRGHTKAQPFFAVRLLEGRLNFGFVLSCRLGLAAVAAWAFRSFPS